jgi:transcriptional regulator with XRE-family HTH domain
MQVQTQEARIILAIEAIRTSKNLSRRAAARRYNISESTLRDRMNGRTTMADRRPKAQKLTTIEEDVIVEYILHLDARGYPPLMENVAAMANHILQSRNASAVGKLWSYRFVQRRKELKTRFSRAYDFQRALCEDPDAIGAWFQLVANMRAKYGVTDGDLYNFDETGFMMGMICPNMVVTRSDRRGKSKAIQPGNREWATAITCISGDGFDVPPFLLVQGVCHLANWYTEGSLPES